MFHLYGIKPNQLGYHHFRLSEPHAIFEKRGSSENDFIAGEVGLDLLDGGLGKDILIGTQGDDIYVVDHRGDTVMENDDDGFDTIQTSVTYTLPKNVECLVLIGNFPINGTGNKKNNRLIGNEANNHLNGAGGADLLIGGGGNDTYKVDHDRDQVIEYPCQGIDTIEFCISYALGEDVENLILIGEFPINGIGNRKDNIIKGNDNNNFLDGMGGNDTLMGGAGSDIYFMGFGYGHQTIIEHPYSPGKDRIKFIDIQLKELQFERIGNNLEIYIKGATDYLTVQDYYATSTPTIEEFYIGDQSLLPEYSWLFSNS